MTRILAYANRVSARPGDTVEVMVSCDGIESYAAELVRVVQGDTNPAGPGFHEELVALDPGGPFRGRYQPIHTGSCGIVPDDPAFKGLESLGLLAAVWPTLPGQDAQTILSRWNPSSSTGFRLFIDADEALAFELRGVDGNGAIVSTGKPLIAEKWYVVAAGYHAGTGELDVRQRPLIAHAKLDDAGFVSIVTAPGLAQDDIGAPVMLAVQSAEGQPATHQFNGRIDSPSLWSHPITNQEMHQALVHDNLDRDGLVAA